MILDNKYPINHDPKVSLGNKKRPERVACQDLCMDYSGERCSGEQFQMPGSSDSLGTAVDAQLGIDMIRVPFHRAQGDEERLCNFRI